MTFLPKKDLLTLEELDCLCFAFIAKGVRKLRLTCTGTLYMCLGQNDAADLRAALCTSDRPSHLAATIDEAIFRTPKGRDFIIDRNNLPAVSRHMIVTGG